MPQPDSGGNCCDCPSRTSPCEDCGGAPGACCIAGVCSTLSAIDCASAGGYYNGDGSLCESVECGEQPCCYDSECGAGTSFCGPTPRNCTSVLPDYCTTLPGGVVQATCDESNCPPHIISVCCPDTSQCCDAGDPLFFNICCPLDQVCCDPIDPDIPPSCAASLDLCPSLEIAPDIFSDPFFQNN